MESWLPWITGSGGALVVLAIVAWGFYIGKLHSDPEFRTLEKERDYWKDGYAKQVEANQIERRIVNQTAEAGQVNNQLLTAFVNLASGRLPAPVPGLPAEDLSP